MNLLYKIALFGVIFLFSAQSVFCGCYKADTTRHWPSSRIPYTIDPTWPASLEQWKAGFHVAASYISAATNLCFVEATPQDSIYVLITYNGTGTCSVNRVGYPPSPSLVASGMFSQPTVRCAGDNITQILHEFMHVLGFVHEQQRPDRDDHIEVFEDCIHSNWSSQFTKLPSSGYMSSSIYDYHSVMHYSNTGLTSSLSCSKTMESIDYPGVKMGQNSFLSPVDVETINFLYPEVCDECSELSEFTYNYNGQYNIADDVWGDPLVPYVFNLNSDVDVSTAFEGSLFMTSSESISLQPDFYIDGYDALNNESTMCLEIDDCNASTASKTILNAPISNIANEVNIFPNPVTDWTNLTVSSKGDNNIKIEILALNGRVIKSMDVGQMHSGKQNIRVDMSDLYSGIYLFRVSGDNWFEMEKVFKN